MLIDIYFWTKSYLMRFLVIVKLVACVEAHRTLFTAVFLHGMSPEMLVKLCLIIESLVTVFALVRFVEVARKYVRFEVPEFGDAPYNHCFFNISILFFI